MKNIILFSLVILVSLSSLAQSPEKFSFQAVVRDGDNRLISEEIISMKISILEGAVSGRSVYEELHQPRTNANGLVSIEIGDGSVLSGSFADIDWQRGTYFVKTETDPSGGSNYNVVGVSQLLSVPFALFSNASADLIGGVSSKETDPFFDASPAKSITGEDINFWNHHTIDTKLTASDIVDFGFIKGPHTDSSNVVSFGFVTGPHTDSTAIANMGFSTEKSANTYSIGDFAQGGIIFWLDETGQHGLVCAKVDQSTAARWFAGTNGHTHAKGDGLFAGEANTAIAISSQIAIGDDGDEYAARMCNELTVTEGGITYGDWYLPSKAELNLMYLNKDVINSTAQNNGGSAFASDFYWSSTELTDRAVSAQQFNAGIQLGHNKNTPRNVRAIRAF